MKSKYLGTFVGFCFTLPGLFTLISEEMIIFSAASVMTFIPIALPLELLGNLMFDKYSFISFLVLFGLTIAFGLTSYYFFKNIILDRNQNNPLNLHRFLLYFGLQLIILHPLVFYIWAFKNSSKSGDGQFIFGAIETFPISSVSFFILGIISDFLKNKKQNIEI